MWNLPRPGIELVACPLAGGFLTTGPLGNSKSTLFWLSMLIVWIQLHLTEITANAICPLQNLLEPPSVVEPPSCCGAQIVKDTPAKQETQVQALDWEDPLEKEPATHSSMLAWEFPCTEELGGWQSMGSQKNWTQLRDRLSLCCIWKNKVTAAVGVMWWQEEW